MKRALERVDGQQQAQQGKVQGRPNKIPRLSNRKPVSNSMKAQVIDLTTPSPPPEPQPQMSYLHRLPAELRNRIYRHIGLRSARLDLCETEEPALTVAIPDLRDELHSIIFAENKLRVNVYTDHRTRNHHIPPPLRRAHKDGIPVGAVALEQGSWVRKVEPRFVAIKHICFHVKETNEENLCDFFLNVRGGHGEAQVSGRMLAFVSTCQKAKLAPVADLARARARDYAKRKGFEGFSWEEVEGIAASFVSVEDASRRFTKKCGKVELV